ncbi:MAG: restriction endonuclease subunit S [bacterium]|nr:restriction endonuclease subunit S [bacterium]
MSVKGSRLLICRKNTPELVGSTVFTPKAFPNTYIPDLIWQTVPSTEKEHDIKFIFFMLNEDKFKWRIRNLASGSSRSMVNISKNSFLKLPIPLPPLPEQQKIAAILSTWDRAIALTRKLLQEKEAQKKG